MTNPNPESHAMSDEKTEQRGRWVPAITFEAAATPKQRARNYAFYERIRDGVPGSDTEQGLKAFWFDVPNLPMFRLDPEHDCYRRLVSYIVGHTDAKCDADDEVERLTTERDSLRAQLAKVRADLDTMIAVHDDVERERDELIKRIGDKP